jgi:hypothetical protein
MDYSVAFGAPPEKIYQNFTSREYWQTLMATGESGTDTGSRPARRLDPAQHQVPVRRRGGVHR